MRNIYTCLFLLIAFLAFGQTTTEVDEQNNLASSKLNQNPRQALEIATKAKAAAEEIKYPHGANRAIALMGVAYYKTDQYSKSVDYFDLAVVGAKGSNDTSNLAFALYWKGNAALNEGQYPKALDLYHEAYLLAGQINDKRNIARAIDGKASIYESLNEIDKAEELYRQSLKMAKEANFTEWYPNVIFSLGNIAYNKGKTQDAIKAYTESIELSDKEGNLNNKANCLQQLAYVYYDKNDSKTAMQYIQQAMDLFHQTGSLSSFSYSRLLMSAILLKDKQWDDAISLAQQSFDEGRAKKETRLQKEAAEILYYAYVGKGNTAAALNFHVLFHRLSETGHSEELTKKLTQLELQGNFQREREIEAARQARLNAEMNASIERQKIIKKTYMVGLGLIAIIAGLAIFAFMQKRKDTRLIAREKRKSDQLLMSILPSDVVNEIRRGGAAGASQISTVLFADIKSPALEISHTGREAQERIKAAYLAKFDEIIARHGLERIKNAGDAYLCITEPAADNPRAANALQAAFDILKYAETIRHENQAKGQPYFDVSIGMHSGPLVAGIVGIHKTGHDVWGDTVTIATRMEQHGEPGKVNVSAATYRLLGDTCRAIPHGKIMGIDNTEIDMYLIETPQ